MLAPIAALLLASGTGSLPGEGVVVLRVTRERPALVSLAATPRLPDPLLAGLRAASRVCPYPACTPARPNVPPGFALPWVSADELVHAVARRFDLDGGPVTTAAMWLASNRLKVDLRPDHFYLAIRLGGS